MIDVSFDATDVSELNTILSHLMLLNHSVVLGLVSPSQTTIHVTETIDVEAFGISNATLGAFSLFMFVISSETSAQQVEVLNMIRTLPSSSISFANRIEREDILGVEHFVIPYTFTYNSDYAEVLYKNENNNIGGVDSAILKTLLPDELTSNTYTETYKIPVANYGSTKINVSVIDQISTKILKFIFQCKTGRYFTDNQ